MKNSIVVILTLWANLSIAQLSDVLLLDSNDQKVTFRVLSDNYACLIFDQIDYRECELVHMEKSNDTVYLKRSIDYLRNEPSVFLSNTMAQRDSILIEMLFEHPFMEGHALMYDLHYKIDDVNYSPDSMAVDYFKHQITIKRPDQDKFKLSIYDGTELIGDHTIHLEKSQNLIHIVQSEIYSYVLYFNDYNTVFPCTITLDGKSQLLVYQPWRE